MNTSDAGIADKSIYMVTKWQFPFAVYQIDRFAASLLSTSPGGLGIYRNCAKGTRIA